MIIKFSNIKNEINYPEIKNEFEILNLSNNKIILNSCYGKQILISSPSVFANDFLELCNGYNKISYIKKIILEKFINVRETEINFFYNQLINLNVIAEGLYNLRPSEINVDMFNRFKTEITHFQHFEKDGLNAFDLFLKLRNSKVTIIGTGGNGSLAAMMLAAAGVGHIKLIDGDTVDESNLVRQIFYTENDAKKSVKKSYALKKRIKKLSKYTEVEVSEKFVECSNDVRIQIKDSTCVILCADAPRFVINNWVNDACFDLNIPYINAFAGIVGPFTIPNKTACFNCLENKYRKHVGIYHDEIVKALQKNRTRQYPSFVTGPVLVAQLQVSEVVSYLTGIKSPKTINKFFRINEIGGENLESILDLEFCTRCSHQITRREVC